MVIVELLPLFSGIEFHIKVSRITIAASLTDEDEVSIIILSN